MEKTRYSGNFVRVTEQAIGGKVYERAYFKDAVVVIPFTESGKIIFIREKRVHENPPERIKLVTGFCEPHLSVEENANKELQEEIGKKASKIAHYLTEKNTGSVNETKHYVIATGLSGSKIHNPDGDDSILDVFEMDLDEMFDFLVSGKYRPGTTAFVLMKLFHDLKRKNLTLS